MKNNYNDYLEELLNSFNYYTNVRILEFGPTYETSKIFNKYCSIHKTLNVFSYENKIDSFQNFKNQFFLPNYYFEYSEWTSFEFSKLKNNNFNLVIINHDDCEFRIITIDNLKDNVDLFILDDYCYYNNHRGWSDNFDITDDSVNEGTFFYEKYSNSFELIPNFEMSPPTLLLKKYKKTMIKYIGRTGNNLIQYFTSYFFSRKFNLPFDFPQECPKNWESVIDGVIKWGEEFGVNPNDFIVHGDDKVKSKTCTINDYNFEYYYKQNYFNMRVWSFDGYFQNKEFLFSKRNEIKKLLNIRYDDSINKDDVLVHYRLGDIELNDLHLPLSYYDNLLSEIKFNKGYIISDSLNSDNCKYLIQKYNLHPFDDENPAKVINFAKNFNNLVLSDGTFSWWIAFLSDAKNIFYGKSDKVWTINNIFSDEWKQIKV